MIFNFLTDILEVVSWSTVLLLRSILYTSILHVSMSTPEKAKKPRWQPATSAQNVHSRCTKSTIGLPRGSIHQFKCAFTKDKALYYAQQDLVVVILFDEGHKSGKLDLVTLMVAQVVYRFNVMSLWPCLCWVHPSKWSTSTTILAVGTQWQWWNYLRYDKVMQSSQLLKLVGKMSFIFDKWDMLAPCRIYLDLPVHYLLAASYLAFI